MFYRLLLLFIVVPFVELTLLLVLAEYTGWLFALALILVTGTIGSFLAHRQGWKAWRNIASELSAGKMPGQALLDGVMILFAGALLLTPGILTDFFGFSLLIPPCRQWYGKVLKSYFRDRFHIQSFTDSRGTNDTNSKTRPSSPEVIDAEFEKD